MSMGRMAGQFLPGREPRKSNWAPMSFIEDRRDLRDPEELGRLLLSLPKQGLPLSQRYTEVPWR